MPKRAEAKEHDVEIETRGKFDILLALRLCDFSMVKGLQLAIAGEFAQFT